MEMKSKQKKQSNQSEGSVDFLSLVVKTFKDSVINILVDGFGQMKKEFQMRVSLGIQTFISLATILIGLIFVLNGLANLIEAVIEISGSGFFATGLLVVFIGVWLGEKVKSERDKL